MDETLNKDLYELESVITSEEVFEEENTTTSEEVFEEESTTISEEVFEEESTTTSEEIFEEESITTSEEVFYSEVGYDDTLLVEELQKQNDILTSIYDVTTFIFIVLLFILFRTYVIHILEHIRSYGK